MHVAPPKPEKQEQPQVGTVPVAAPRLLQLADEEHAVIVLRVDLTIASQLRYCA